LVQIVQFDLQGAKKISPFNPEFLFKKAFRVLALDQGLEMAQAKDGLTLVERYFVEELKSHFGESLAWKWLACEKRRKFTEEGVCLMPRSSSQAHAALGMKQSMQRSHSESSLGSLHSKA
jgi:hypothetical protein